jgi:hypothetical protein
MNEEEVKLAGRVLAQAIALAVVVAMVEAVREKEPMTTPRSGPTAPISFGEASGSPPRARRKEFSVESPCTKGKRGLE